MTDWTFPRRTPCQNSVLSATAIDSAGIPWRTELDEGPSTPITLLEETLYVGTSPAENRLYALEASTGAVQWSAEFDDWLSHITTDGQSLYVSTSDSVLRSIDPSDGTVRWTESFPKRGLRAALPVDGSLYVSSAHGMLYSLDSTDGSENWHQWHNNYTPSAPAVSGDSLYLSVGRGDDSSGGRVHSYHLDGSQKWSFNADARIDEGYQFAGVDPLVVDGALIASSGPTVFSLSAATGELRWQTVVSGERIEAICASSDEVFVGTDAGTLAAVEIDGGGIEWMVENDYPVAPDLTLHEEHLLVSQPFEGVCLYNAESGESMKELSDDGNHFTPAIAHDGVLFFGSKPNSSGMGMCHAIPLPHR
jgi:outer membrane protein assembly factor BamB